MAQANLAVCAARRFLAMCLGPKEVLLVLDVNAQQDLTATEVEVAVDCRKRGIRKLHLPIKGIFIEAQSFSIAVSCVLGRPPGPNRFRLS